MLKIYLSTINYYLQNEDRIEYLNRRTYYKIVDEKDAVPKTIELGAYTREAQAKYPYICEMKQRKKGRLARYYSWPDSFRLTEWKAPNAKLVMHITYEEASCSMKELMNLPTQDVIAYFKQEGMDLVMHS